MIVAIKKIMKKGINIEASSVCYIIIYISANLLLGQSDFSFRNITVKDGLAESTVKVIFEDKQGFIYFGTENGLDIYDGYQFYNYHSKSFDDESMLGNKVSSIYEDKIGMIWVGTELGMSRLNPSTRTFSRPVRTMSNPELSLSNIETIREDKNSNLWLKQSETGKIFKLVTNTGIAECFNCSISSTLQNNNVNVLFKDMNGFIWFGTDLGLFYYDNDLNEIVKYDIKTNGEKVTITCLTNGSVNDIWIGTNNGLFKLNNSINEKLILFKADINKNSLVSNYIKDIEWNELKGELWVATSDGLSRYIPSENKFYNIKTTPYADSIIENDVSEIMIAKKSDRLWFTTSNHSGLNCLSVVENPYGEGLDTVFTHFDHDPVDPNSIADDNITGFIEDKAGHIWIGTTQNGVSFNSFVKPKFVSLRYDQENEWGLKSDKIYAITTQTDGMMWVSTGYGIELLSPDGIREYEYEKSFIDANIVMDLEIINDEDLWVASDKGVLLIDTMEDEIIRFSTSDTIPKERRIKDDLINDILPLNNGFILVGTGSGVIEIDTVSFKTRNIVSDVNARVIFQDMLDNIWIGTEVNGLYKLSHSQVNQGALNQNDIVLERFIFDPGDSVGLSSSQITCLNQDKEGYLWVGTNSGLNKYHGEGKEFTHFFVEDGLSSNYITGITIDQNNDLWISSKKGISFFRQKDSSFINYSVTDGIGNIDFHRNSYNHSIDGNMYFGGPMGITKVNPAIMQYNDYQPPCIITRIKKISFDDSLNETFLSTKGDSLSKNKSTVIIDHTVKSFSVDFVSLNYHKSQKNKYRYKLVPFDRDWIESGGLRFASYNNLGRNTYEFMVQGSNDDGIWSKNEVLKVKFIPHPLLSYSAFGIYFALIVLGIFTFIRHRMRKQKHELEEERRIKELEQAREFQMSLIPQKAPEHPDYDIALHMKTSTEVGGDYYDFFPQDDGSMYVVVGDATGHGLNAGMMVSITKAGLYGSNFDTPSNTTTRLNKTIKAIDLGTTRMSLNMAKFHNGSFDFTSAGMPPAYLYKGESGTVDEILVPGLPLGSMKKADFDLHTFHLKPEDALVLISDGLPECINHNGEMLDYDAVKECVKQNGKKSAQGIIESLVGLGDNWMSGLMNDDDITLVVIKKR